MKFSTRFPNSKREEWENIFPSFTTREEIGLVDSLVKYNPKQRLTAKEVSNHLNEKPLVMA
jgi:cell cycle related kinase